MWDGKSSQRRHVLPIERWVKEGVHAGYQRTRRASKKTGRMGGGGQVLSIGEFYRGSTFDAFEQK